MRCAQVITPLIHFPPLNLNYQAPEHTVEVGGANAQPSHCTLPMFHPPMDAAGAPAGHGYESNDGHYFACRNPVVLQHAFHVCVNDLRYIANATLITTSRSIFVIDRLATLHFFLRTHNLQRSIRSGSMSLQDRQPPPGSSGIERIERTANNRLGAVFSALYSFWIERQAAVDRNSLLGRSRKDAYSLIFFNHEPSTSIENDFTSSPDELLTAALQFNAIGGKDFSSALETAQKVMTSHWCTERYGSFPQRCLRRSTIY